MNKYLMACCYILLLFCGACKTNSGTKRLLGYPNSVNKESCITSSAGWQQKRLQLLDSMQASMGKLPPFSNLPGFDLKTTDSLQGIGYTRYTISFRVASDERLWAYLYIPDKTSYRGLLPAMLALHETDFIGKKSVDGQGHNPNLGYAKELAQRGYIVIAPDYPGFGDLKSYDFSNSRYQSGTMKSIFDDMRCVDLLLARADVDPLRIGIIGHSLGGHSALFAAAFDTRLKVVVSSCGWTLFDAYNIGDAAAEIYGGRLGPWAQPRYMPLLRTVYKLDQASIPFDFDGVIATIAPRACFSIAPLKDGNFSVAGVKRGIKNAAAVYHLLQADKQLQCIYPNAGHDFPAQAREAAYLFIDETFHHIPVTNRYK